MVAKCFRMFDMFESISDPVLVSHVMPKKDKKRVSHGFALDPKHRRVRDEIRMEAHGVEIPRRYINNCQYKSPIEGFFEFLILQWVPTCSSLLIWARSLLFTKGLSAHCFDATRIAKGHAWKWRATTWRGKNIYTQTIHWPINSARFVFLLVSYVLCRSARFRMFLLAFNFFCPSAPLLKFVLSSQVAQPLVSCGKYKCSDFCIALVAAVMGWQVRASLLTRPMKSSSRQQPKPWIDLRPGCGKKVDPYFWGDCKSYIDLTK